ncbi:MULTISPECIES: alpha/beta fold hydrolase [Mycobacterium]|uniref:Alpha/beta hydrolase n=1 Tax=Mycobacterium kiyosense TaxID=2871094 RepID=A0A9P3Q4R5_9MYCO|nr:MULTISPECIES: alpha/beta fold hydrolase [Mycobacterium]BDE15432.1 hypothetical protein MKCMC460_42920 [Mycobacterium sp. 20KCMC460]GLB81142.1 hypothetical protein SRL2020028_03980 [Mycobacterium kiyosense]GLB90451.1 hypothetical protein SRL2020130_32680 [Mycobacterium kiyosense]GLB93623.1 hypothetical protein SRL2020226_03990 [Mycobacterium kiyosense]GLC04542.1 hypothetical protein SRL2020400_51330 [Mycobacterium kiyosense]
MLELIARGSATEHHRIPLLLHGSWHGAWCWDEHFLGYLADRGYACHALSVRGHGACSPSTWSNPNGLIGSPRWSSALKSTPFLPHEIGYTATLFGVEPELFRDMGRDMMLETGWQAVAERIDNWLTTHRF